MLAADALKGRVSSALTAPGSIVTRSFAPLPLRTTMRLVPEVEILPTEARGLEQAQAAPVEHQRHEARDAMKVLQDRADLGARHDDGEVRGAPRAHEVVEPGEVLFEHFLVEEQQRAERLVLGGCGNPALDGERGQETA